MSFSIPEMLSLFGVAQCLYVLVYMAFRAGEIRRCFVPFLYFGTLGISFFLDFSTRFLGGASAYYPLLQWFFWFLGPPLSVLLILQIARIREMPPAGSFLILLLPVLAASASLFIVQGDRDCSFPAFCPLLNEWLVITGLLAGAASMAAIWGHRRIIAEFREEKGGKERYWLILTLIFVNLFFLAIMLASLSPSVEAENVSLARTILGLALGYLAGTSLFRIYPQSLPLSGGAKAKDQGMTEEDVALANKITRLLDIDKVYQEASYGRAELARELKVPETAISRVINAHFGKSFPRLLNERRIEDAKRLLQETSAPIKVIAQEAGFNSIASFNRVFREIAGESPTTYRGRNL